MEQQRIEGVIIKSLGCHVDQRGWLIELFRLDEIDNASMPAMAYISMTRTGVVRGPHEHRDQADFFGFIGPSRFRLYLWDNRRDSATYGAKLTVDAGEGDPKAVFVPAGVVHAYKNIGRGDGLVFNAPNRLYAGKGRSEPVDEVRHEDDPDSPFKVD